jgi:hypothetical protein
MMVLNQMLQDSGLKRLSEVLEDIQEEQSEELEDILEEQ